MFQCKPYFLYLVRNGSCLNQQLKSEIAALSRMVATFY